MIQLPLAKHTTRLIKAMPTQGRWRAFRRWQAMNKTQREEFLHPKHKPEPKLSRVEKVKRAISEVFR